MSTIAILGVGKISEAFLRGFIAAGGLTDHRVILIGRNLTHNSLLAQTWGLETATLSEALLQADILIVAVKPKDVSDVLAEFTTISPIVISFASGLSVEFFESRLAHLGKARVVRAMPNTPMSVRRGVIAITPGTQLTEEDIQTVRTVLELTGTVVNLPESQLPAFTALAGSGPAYVYLIAEALTDAAVAQGLPRALAAHMAVETLAGSAALLEENPDKAAQLRAEVTSPGGTTAAAVSELERGAIRGTFYTAIAAATEKATPKN